ncbi:two-component regulator propeller domain-containing protein [Leeuwenhoekiella marinoflava]|uniref:two-component regulator propeller domain-containing protein n=1 Tax=Leeuwenhoekiella marinoflava TaxID=988 RepID=UPI00300141E8
MKSFAFILILFSNLIFSQEKIGNANRFPEYRFSHIGVADGLSTGSVNCFYKGNNNFMWIGTNTGLNRYDGYTIKTYNPDPLNPKALHTQECRRLFEDPLGNIWIDTPLGISIFNPISEKFSTDQHQILEQLKIPSQTVIDILKDDLGNYWFVHANATLSIYDSTSKTVNTVQLNTKTSESDVMQISSLKLDNTGNFYVIYKNGYLQHYDTQNNRVDFETAQLQKMFSGALYNFKMIVDKANNPWIYLYESQGLFYLDVKTGDLSKFDTNSKRFPLSSNLVSDLVVADNGNIWIGTDHGGIDIISLNDQSIEYVKNNGELSNSLSQNSITALYKDSEGIIWVGTFKNGLDYHHSNLMKFSLEQKLLSKAESLPFNDINVFTEDKNGNLYMGTNGAGLIKLDFQSGKYTQFMHNPDQPGSISSDVIVSLLYDSEGVLWVGTYLGGLNKMIQDQFKVYKNIKNDPTSLAENNVWELFEDGKGNIWVGTINSGVDMLNVKRETFKHYKPSETLNPLRNDYVLAIAEDAKGQIWIGGNEGIDVLNPDTGKYNYFQADYTDKNSLSSNYISTIIRDSKSRMWVGTDSGLNLYNEKENTFYTYTSESGLADNKIMGAVEDNAGNLWLTSPFGLSMFQITPEHTAGKIVSNFKNYKKEDGLQGNIFNDNAIFKTSKGDILVGGLNGYNRFNPLNFEYNTIKPKIVFTDFSLYNKSLNPNEKVNGRVIIDTPISALNKVKLKYDENLFSVEFAALNFIQPSKNKYRYKLEGFDKQWQSATSSQRRVTYTNLDPGEYILKVQASNNDGFWNRKGSSLLITILPPYYKTVYAYILYALLVITILYLARRRIILKQHKNFQIQQEKRESEYLHKMDLMKIKFFTNINHEFKTPLALILASIEKLKKTTPTTQAEEQINSIQQSAKKLLTLLTQILNVSNVKNESILMESKADLLVFTRQIVNSFKDLAENKGVSLTFQSNVKEFHTAFDTDKLDKVLFNLLSNAIKFTSKGGKVKVDFNTIDNSENAALNWVEIVVSDTGVGINEEDQTQIFDRFFKGKQVVEENAKGSGVGLSLVKEYITLFNGKISFKSNPDKGTQFTIELPFQNLNKTEDALKNFEESASIQSTTEELLPALVIIEDDKEFLNFLTRSFEVHYNVFVATDGETGWKKILSVLPDLIMCDNDIPILKGIDLCDKVREDSRTKHIPFVMVTGNEQQVARLKALKKGVSDYITKPFNLETLQTRIANLINQRNLFKTTYSKKLDLTQPDSKFNVENEEEKLMRKVIQIIKKNAGNSNFSVKMLAKEVGVSRSYLYNKTLILFEKSPLKLITDIRLELGKELLEKSQLTISEIAFQTGFNNPKYFTQNFKKKYHKLPSKFRNETKKV